MEPILSSGFHIRFQCDFSMSDLSENLAAQGDPSVVRDIMQLIHCEHYVGDGDFAHDIREPAAVLKAEVKEATATIGCGHIHSVVGAGSNPAGPTIKIYNLRP